MALNHPVEIDNTGMYANYSRITHVAVDFTATRELEGKTIAGSAEVLVHSYADEEARFEGKNPAAVRTLIFRSADLPFDNLSRSALYDAVKATPDFQGAKDV